jgi:hypothetical protein
MISLSDGLFVAAQTDDKLDTDRVIELLIIAMRAVVRSYLADDAPTKKAAPVKKASSPRSAPVKKTATKKATAAKRAAK